MMNFKTILELEMNNADEFSHLKKNEETIFNIDSIWEWWRDGETGIEVFNRNAGKIPIMIEEKNDGTQFLVFPNGTLSKYEQSLDDIFLEKVRNCKDNDEHILSIYNGEYPNMLSFKIKLQDIKDYLINNQILKLETNNITRRIK